LGGAFQARLLCDPLRTQGSSDRQLRSWASALAGDHGQRSGEVNHSTQNGPVAANHGEGLLPPSLKSEWEGARVR